MTTPTELRELDFEELESRLSESKRELFNLRFQVVTGQLDNVSRIRHVRREVARIKTILREQEIAAAEALEETAGSATEPARRRTRREETAGPGGRREETAGPGGRREETAGPGGRREETADAPETEAPAEAPEEEE
jgi:large subunit ribosomal protein L29